VLSVGALRGVWAVRCGSGGGAPVLRALRGAGRGVPVAAFAAAVAGLRQHSTPYHLAHGLLDHAAHLAARGHTDAAAAAVGEAAGIARRLGCQPLLGRAADLSPSDRGSGPRW
jgi:hypothetical protein